MVQKKDDEMKSLIKGINTRVEKAEYAATRTEPEDMHQRRVESLNDEKVAVEKSINRMQDEFKQFERDTQQMRTKEETLIAATESTRKESDAQLPRARDAIRLYANIANIKWDYDASTVKGFVSSEEQKDIRPFNLDPSKNSRFKIVNFLWNLME